MTPRAALALAAIVLCAGCGPSRAVKASMQEGQRAMAARAWLRHAFFGGLSGAAVLTACAAQQWPQVGALWSCVPISMAQGRLTFETSREAVAAYRFQILVASGQRERAVELARSRGWV